MDVAIAGGHGQIGLQLGRMLAARGDRVRGLIRNDDQSGDLREAGVTPVVVDLEHAPAADLAAAIAGADAVVFAAGAGPGSGAARKETMDFRGAVVLLEAAHSARVSRYVMISAMGTDHPPQGDEVFAVYLRAKARADQEVMASDRNWTVVRPGRLTNDEPTGQVALARHVPRGAVSRADVAAVVVAVLDDDRTVGRIFELVGGDTAVDSAVDAALAGPGG